VPTTSTTGFGPIQARKRLGVAEWQVDALVRHGHLAPPNDDGRWSTAEIDALLPRLEQALQAIGNQAPIGPARAALRLSQRLQLDLVDHDIDALVGLDILAPARHATGKPVAFRDAPLFDVPQLDAVGDTCRELIASLIAQRVAWMDASIDVRVAMAALGWQRHEVEQALPIGRFKRYPKADVHALAAGQDPLEVLGGDRELGPDEAATRLRVRRIEFDHCVAASWIGPCTLRDVVVNNRAYPLPVYRASEVDALLNVAGIDWATMRTVDAWWSDSPSPLLAYGLPAEHRGAAVRGFAAMLSARFDMLTKVGFDDRGQWMLTWPGWLEHAPTLETVRGLIEADETVRAVRDRIVLRYAVR
jgi:hypothetical protein